MLQFIEDIQEFLGRMEEITKKRQAGYKGFWRGKGIKISVKMLVRGRTWYREAREGERNLNRGNYTAGMDMYKMICWHEKKISVLLLVFFENKNKWSFTDTSTDWL